MTGIHTNKQGNFQCDFCAHRSYKTANGAISHVTEKHPLEYENAKLVAQVAYLKNQPPKERIVYRDPPAPKDDPRYSAVVYCPVCLTVDSVSIVRGQPIGLGGCFRCGNKGGQLVEHVNVQAGDYKINGSK